VKWVWAFLAAAAFALGATPASAGYTLVFDVKFGSLECGGGTICEGDGALDFTPQCNGGAPCSDGDRLDEIPNFVSYDLFYHSTDVPGATGVAYAGPDDQDGLARVTFHTDSHKAEPAFIAIFSFDLVPIIPGEYTVLVNGVERTVGPGGLHVTSDTLLPFSGHGLHTGYIEWDNASAVGITNIRGALPEPAEWAELLVGFGAAGVAVRRARRRLAPAPR